MQFFSDKLSYVKTHQYLWNFRLLFVHARVKYYARYYFIKCKCKLTGQVLEKRERRMK